MNCKKCGRPMGKKGYCANCTPQAANKKTKEEVANLWCWIVGIVGVLAIILALIFAIDWGTAPETEGAESVSGKHHVEIEIQDYGTIKLELDANAAPITVANFLSLAESGFYDGLTFHRIIEGFMMQGGNNGVPGSVKNIKGEFRENGVDNPLSHTRGAISMARADDMDSASSQFFIVQEDYAAASLDGKYACFGYVTEGIEIVDAICAFSSTVVIDGDGTIPAEDQPVIVEIRVID